MSVVGPLAATLAPVRVRPLVVLVVDDEPVVRRIEREVLEQAGHIVVEAASAGEALEAAGDGRSTVDVLVTDITLPGLQGPELAGRLLARRPGLGVVFTSGYDAGWLPVGQFPGSVFLQKPFTVDALAAAVDIVAAR